MKLVNESDILEESALGSQGDCLNAVVSAEFVEDGGHVEAGRSLGDEQLVRNLLVR